VTAYADSAGATGCFRALEVQDVAVPAVGEAVKELERIASSSLAAREKCERRFKTEIR
jgi:hypothetical protein